jgi:hypothetical protein
MRPVIPPHLAWRRVSRMQHMLVQEPALAWAVSWMTLYDQLDLTLELLRRGGNAYLDEEPVEPWPPNVISFRLRRPR